MKRTNNLHTVPDGIRNMQGGHMNLRDRADAAPFGGDYSGRGTWANNPPPLPRPRAFLVRCASCGTSYTLHTHTPGGLRGLTRTFDDENGVRWFCPVCQSAIPAAG